MKQSKPYQFQLFFLLFLTLAIGISSSVLPWGKFHVRIDNGFKDKILFAHCKSKDDDLHQQSIQPGQTYGFSFGVSLLKKTRFHCNLTYWEYEVDFVAFEDDQQFYNKKCGGRRCNWKGQDDGVYLLNTDQHKWVLRYQWGKT